MGGLKEFGKLVHHPGFELGVGDKAKVGALIDVCAFLKLAVDRLCSGAHGSIDGAGPWLAEG